MDAYDRTEANRLIDELRYRLESTGVAVWGWWVHDPTEHWFQESVDTVVVILLVLGVLALGLSIFLIVNTTNAIISQQVWQIGVMKAVGATRGHVIRVYLMAALIYGALALLIAVPLGAVGAFLLASWILELVNITLTTFPIDPAALIVQVVLAVAVPLAGDIYLGIPGRGAWRQSADRDTWQAIACRSLEENNPAVVLTSRRHRGDKLDGCLQQLRDGNIEVERVYAGSALKFCMLAAGEGDFYPRYSPCSEWDTAAGQALLDGAGGAVLDLQGKALRYNRGGGFTFPNGCHVAEVEIDPDTGVVQILAYTAVDDCGRVINPLLAAGQVHGGVAMGIGQALLEEVVYDADGQLVTGSLMDYAMPRASHMPDIDVSFNEVLDPNNELGVKGIGEGGACGAPPAPRTR